MRDHLPRELLDDLQIFAFLAQKIRDNDANAEHHTAEEFGLNNRSTLYRKLRRLSEWLAGEDLPLLTGRGAKRRLTAAGEQCFEEAERLLPLFRSLQERIRTVPPLVTVGVTSGTAARALVRAIPTV